MRIVMAGLAMVMMLAGPAAAGTPQNPELEDTCGVGTHMVQEQVPPWLDMCGGWFETLSNTGETPQIKITVEVADLLAERADSQYWVSWNAGGCRFTVQRMDGGAQLTPGDALSRLNVQCDPGREVPCDTPFKELGYTCWEFGDVLLYDVSGSYSESGDRLSWTLRFDGALAQYAKHHAMGSSLRNPSAMTTVGVNSAPIIGPGYCTRSNDEPWSCQNQVTDWIPSGRDYVVGS